MLSLQRWKPLTQMRLPRVYGKITGTQDKQRRIPSLLPFSHSLDYGTGVDKLFTTVPFASL